MNGNLLLVLFFVLQGCNLRKEVVSKNEIVNPIDASFIFVTVVDKHSLDGCTFVLMKKDSTYLEPINLADSLKVNGEKLFVKYHLKKNSFSICMAGLVVELDEIKKINK